MNNDAPICVQGIDATTAVVGAILLSLAVSMLTCAVWWVALLRAPMPSGWPRLEVRWLRPRTWPAVLVWSWIIVREVWSHTRGKAKQVRDNAVGREIADGNDMTVPVRRPSPRAVRRG